MDKARVTCPGCKRKLSYGMRGCFYCGTSLIDVHPEIKCNMCGNILSEYEKSCTFCGNVIIQEEKSIPTSAGIPELPESFIFPLDIMKNINLSPEAIEFEKGNPPEDYEVPWKFMVEFNCYHIDVFEDEHAIAPATKISREIVMNFAKFRGKSFDLRALEINLLTYYIFELFFVTDNIKNREVLIDHNFNYKRVLGAEMGFNRAINFRNMVKMIRDYLPKDVKVNTGVLYLTGALESI